MQIRIKLIATLILLTMLLPNCREKADTPSKLKNLSRIFKYSITYTEPTKVKEAHFIATLTNVSDATQRIELNDKEFFGELSITTMNSDYYEAYNPRYLGLLCTSIIDLPVIELGANESIVWHVPLSSLVSARDKKVTHESLTGGTVRSTMKVTAIADDGNYIEGNASQRSNILEIK